MHSFLSFIHSFIHSFMHLISFLTFISFIHFLSFHFISFRFISFWLSKIITKILLKFNFGLKKYASPRLRGCKRGPTPLQSIASSYSRWKVFYNTAFLDYRVLPVMQQTGGNTECCQFYNMGFVKLRRFACNAADQR